MGITDRLGKLNRSRWSAAAVCALILLLMLLCNFRTNLLADDYRYCFRFDDLTRLDSLSDIVPSMAAHREVMNGRLAAHALVQLFLLLPLPVFKLLNSLMFLALILLMYGISVGGGRNNALLLLSLFGGVWVLQLDFGQVFLWLDGAVNYLWCAVLSLAFLLPYIGKFTRGRELSAWETVGFTLFSFIVGGYSENSTVAVVFMAVLLLALARYFDGGRPRLWSVLSLAAALLGFALMLFAPAELVNKSSDFSLPVLWSNFLETGRIWLLYWPALLTFAALYIAAVQERLPLKLRALALVFFGGSLAGHFVLSFAMYCAFRSTYITLVLLLVACGLLFAPLFESGKRVWLCALSALCLVFTLYWGYVGVRDITRTYHDLSFNEQLLSQCVAEGESVVQLPRFYPDTRYSAMSGLNYLNAEDPDDWSNVYMAKYYGVEKIIAY